LTGTGIQQQEQYPSTRRGGGVH